MTEDERLDREPALAARRGQHGFGAERAEHGRRVGRVVGVGQHAADGRDRADAHVGDGAERVGQRLEAARAEACIALDLAMGHERAQRDPLPGTRHASQLIQAAQRDEGGGRLHQAGRQQRADVRAPGHRQGLLTQLAAQCERLGERARVVPDGLAHAAASSRMTRS